MVLSSRSWLRVAGLSGASAVILGTYGAHAFHPEDDHYLATFETANKYHFIHSLLIGLAPSARFDVKPCYTLPAISCKVLVVTVLHVVQKAVARWVAGIRWRCTLLRKVGFEFLPCECLPFWAGSAWNMLIPCSLYTTALTEDNRNSKLAPTG